MKCQWLTCFRSVAVVIVYCLNPIYSSGYPQWPERRDTNPGHKATPDRQKAFFDIASVFWCTLPQEGVKCSGGMKNC